MQQSASKSNRGSLQTIADAVLGALGIGNGSQSNDTEILDRETVDASTKASENSQQEVVAHLSTDVAKDASSLSDSSIAIESHGASTEPCDERKIDDSAKETTDSPGLWTQITSKFRANEVTKVDSTEEKVKPPVESVKSALGGKFLIEKLKIQNSTEQKRSNQEFKLQ